MRSARWVAVHTLHEVRHIGNPPQGANTIEPTIEDGYLLLIRDPTAIEEPVL